MEREPVVGGEGEKPVRQNPVVGQPDPRYLSNFIIEVFVTMMAMIIIV